MKSCMIECACIVSKPINPYVCSILCSFYFYAYAIPMVVFPVYTIGPYIITRQTSLPNMQL